MLSYTRLEPQAVEALTDVLPGVHNNSMPESEICIYIYTYIYFDDRFSFIYQIISVDHRKNY